MADAGASGKAHVFQRNAVSGQWQFVQTLAQSVPAAGGQFGFATVVRGDRLFVGANLERPGAVYVFRRTGATWTQAAVLRREGFDYVFVLEPDSRVKLTKVDVGRRNGDRAEITTTLADGAQIVASGVGFLNDGDLVRVVAQP